MPQDNYVVIVITNPTTGAVLMTERAGNYCFPGGRIVHSETPLDAALRTLDDALGLQAGAVAIGTQARRFLPGKTTSYTTGKTYNIVYATARDGDGLLDTLKLNPDEVESAKWFVPASCKIVDEPDSSRGVVRIVDADDTYIEGATADVVHALFELWNQD